MNVGKNMNLLWLSGRVIGSDMAGTTEEMLCSNLRLLGNEVVLISPGRLEQPSIEHISIPRIGIQGLETLTAARNIGKVLKEKKERFMLFDVVLVDWRFVRMLRNDLEKLGIPWIIIDRGPPVTSGIFGKGIKRELLRNLQKIFWKSAWKEAGRTSIGGFVVSGEHSKLVRKLCNDKPIGIIPAGSVKNKYLATKSDVSELLKISYVGRIDRKRGLQKIIDFSESLNTYGVEHHITFAGEGDLGSKFSEFNSDKFSNVGKISQDEVMVLLAEQHVGIMPMPDLPIWRIASPLKLAEYLASGLAIVGPSHPGNRVGENEQWNLLSENNWWSDCAKKLSELAKENTGWESRFVFPAIESSKSLMWDIIALKMSKDIKLMKAGL